MKNKCFFQRIGAFFIDALLVAIVAALFSRISLINPYYDEYEEVYSEYYNYVLESAKVGEETASTDILNSPEMDDLMYKVSYYNSYTQIITLVIIVLYFVVFQYFNNGQTIGKAIFKIKLSSEKKKLSIWMLLLRTTILKNLITNGTLTAMLMICSKASYLKYSSYIDIIGTAVLLVNASFFLTRDDGKALHDIICKTKVTKINE